MEKPDRHPSRQSFWNELLLSPSRQVSCGVPGAFLNERCRSGKQEWLLFNLSVAESGWLNRYYRFFYTLTVSLYQGAELFR